MSNHHTDAHTYDCGDGVPDLPLMGDTVVGARTEPFELPAEATIGIGAVVMVLIVLGQLFLLLAVLAGGNALVGAVAGAALLVCGLTLIGARNLRRTLFGG